MNLYFAESGSMFRVVHASGRTFRGKNILQSFWYCDDFTERVIIPEAQSFMLDSGAFTFCVDKKKAHNEDLEHYTDRYIDFINRNGIDLFFEMDIDAIIGYENVLKLRHRIEAGTGKRCIPVWHPERGKEEFLRMCEEYPYVALGGVVGSGKLKKQYNRVAPWFVREAHKRGAKIHGLGMTSLPVIAAAGFDSVDSSSWSSGCRYGVVYKFTGNGIKQLKKSSGRGRLHDYKALTCSNFDEWVKYQDYARKHI